MPAKFQEPVNLFVHDLLKAAIFEEIMASITLSFLLAVSICSHWFVRVCPHDGFTHDYDELVCHTSAIVS
ncbi:hypothetical protein CCR75_006882 [Bremia lactucae]|uniref:Uncharacterized protein n=1 Tax=Bremia lactucae TaxID=4779 RepID=A0A976FJ34_BRELC|nr:hypothetical protein CCR75_006882 [Bremia lactucae]